MLVIKNYLQLWTVQSVPPALTKHFALARVVMMFVITSAQLKVFSAVCSDMVVVWLAGSLAANGDMVVLTRNIILAMMSWKAAVLAEEKLEEL